MADDRALYDELIKRIQDSSQNLEVDDLVNKSADNLANSRQTRDLFENTLGHKYLKDTGVSIPDIKRAPSSEVESFLNKIKEEAYPELRKTSIEVPNNVIYKGKVADAIYHPSKDLIQVSQDALNHQTPEGAVGSLFHELGHAYDKKTGLHLPSVDDSMFDSAKKALLKINGVKTGTDLTKLDSSVINEIQQLGHHAHIPNLREGSFGKGALSSLIKSKTFKALPYIGPALAGGLTLAATGDASAATQAAIPIINEADTLGPEAGSPESMVEDPTKTYEQRKKAIEQLSQRRIQNGE